MKKDRMKRTLIVIVLTLLSLSCVEIESLLCEATGGKWVESDYSAGRTRSRTSSSRWVCDRNFNQAKYDAWENYEEYTDPEEAGDEPVADDEPVSVDESAADDDPVAVDEPAVDDDPAEQISVEGEDGGGAIGTVPAGTYVGSTDLPEKWAEFPGTDVANQITIIVADDGTVTGSLIVIREGDAMILEETDCVIHTDFDVSGAPSGQLTDVNRTISIHMDYYWAITYAASCDAETIDYSEVYDFPAEIRVSGDLMTGTVPEYFTFEATRR